MWGSPALSHRILLNGLGYNVPHNLHDFLMVARERKYKEWIWIDQICIAQSDTTERNHQVSIMADIYCGAASGIVWLGQCLSEEAALIHDFLDGCRQKTVDELNGPAFSKTEKAQIPDLIKRTEAALAMFSGNAYWSRLWIIQELKLLRYFRFWWGSYDLDHKGFSHLWFHTWSRFGGKNSHPNTERIEWLIGETSHPEANSSGNRTLSTRYPRYMTSGRHRRQADYKLREVVEQICQADCTDPRDKIFGVQSILCPTSKQTIDYNKNVESLLIEAWEILIAEWRRHESGGPNLLGILKLCYRLATAMLSIVKAQDTFFRNPQTPHYKTVIEGFQYILDAGPRPANIIWPYPPSQNTLQKVACFESGTQQTPATNCRRMEYHLLSSLEKAKLCTNIVLEEIVEHKYVRAEVDQVLQALDRINAQQAAQAQGRPWGTEEFPQTVANPIQTDPDALR